MVKKLGFWMFCLFIFSCSNTKNVVKKAATTGIINYAIKIDAKKGVPVSAETFGDKAIINFNDKFIHFRKENGQGAGESFQLINVANGEETNYLNFRGKKYALTTSEDMLPPIGELVFQNEKKEILGIECQKATAKMGDGEVIAWFTNEIGINFCPYIKAKGFALEYSLPMPFGQVTYTATQVKLNQNDSTLLTPPSDYKKITMAELQQELSGVGPPPMEVGMDAPSFISHDLEGNLVDLKKLKGKVVLLNFWFINCAPCRREMPDLNELKKEYTDKDVVFIGITFDRNNQVKEFLKKTPFEFQIIADARQIIDKYKIQGFPTSVVLDRDGKVVDSKMGGSFNIKDELKAFIEKALK